VKKAKIGIAALFTDVGTTNPLLKNTPQTSLLDHGAARREGQGEGGPAREKIVNLAGSTWGRDGGRGHELDARM